MTDDNPPLVETEALRAVLQSEAPDGPDPMERMTGLIRRRRHRRQAQAGTSVFAVAAITLGVVAIPHLTSTPNETNQSNPLPAATAPQLAPSCDKPLAAGDRETLGPNGDIPTGALSARICAGRIHSWYPPLDLLTTGLDGVVATFNVRQHTSDHSCPAPFEDVPYTITFAYPDGKQVAVSADAYSGCQFTHVAGWSLVDGRDAATPMLQAFVNALEAQRTHERQPQWGDRVRPSCPQPNDMATHQTPLAHVVLRAAHVLACRYVARSPMSGPRLVGQAWLDGDQVAAADRDLAAHAVRAPVRHGTDCLLKNALVGCQSLQLYLVNRWGDVIRFDRYDPTPTAKGQLGAVFAWVGHPLAWRIEPSTLHMIERALQP